jgi:mannose-6-phosphate isomerase-like protein (cupin superfamily)
MNTPIDTDALRAAISRDWHAETLTTQGGVNLKFRVMRNTCSEFHTHEEWDECFFVLSGVVTIDLANSSHELSAGKFFVVPRGASHRSRVQGEATLLVLDQGNK